MTNYIPAEKLIAEIERRKNESRKLAQEHKNSSLGKAAQTMANEDEEILSIIASLQQEQPEVDLEKEIDRLWPDLSDEISGPHNKFDIYARIARHFYGLRNRALEEAARNVYESWMGGTMDDVRRDMVELGKILNARKEE